jgi:hypothetical protein
MSSEVITADDTRSGTDSPDADPPRAPRVRRWILLGVSLWAVIAGWTLWNTQASANRGVRQLEELKESLSPAALLRGSGEASLRSARDSFAVANRGVDSPWLLPVRYLPWVRRQLNSVEALTGSAVEVADVGLDALAEFREALDDDRRGGTARVELSARLRDVAAAAADRVEATDLGPVNLIGPLASARSRFATEREELIARLRDVETGAAGVEQFLAGPTRYLVIAANNGEMRAGTGMWLSMGPLEVRDGTIELGDLVPTGRRALPPGAVQVEGDYQQLWGFTSPGVDWRNLQLSPDFPVSAEIAARMWLAQTGTPVDGVIVLDPIALRSLLRATGPVTVEGTTYGPDNVVNELLVEQYRGIDPRNWEQFDEDTAARRGRLSEVAHAIFDRLEAGAWDTAELIEALHEAVTGRHLLVWSSRDQQMAAWRAAGATGEMTPDSLALSLLNQGGTKLDQFLPVDAQISRRRVGAASEMTIKVTVRNDAPLGLPPYVQGPTLVPGRPGVGVPEGVYAGIVTLHVPASATQLRIEGVSQPLVGGRDGKNFMIATRIQLERGTSTEVVFRFLVPRGTTLRVEPSARIPEVHWVDGGREWWDHEPVEVRSG